MELSSEWNELSERIIGAAIEVHRHLGPGYLEAVYEEALAAEFIVRDIAFVRQHVIDVLYKGKPVGVMRLDFVVEERLVVELKATEALLPLHKAQVISYLKSSGAKLGLLINFNVEVLRNGIRRIIFT